MATGNTDRIQVELEKVAQSIPERFAGYRAALVAAAMDCITTTSEHDDKKTNINQQFDSCLEAIARKLTSVTPEVQQ